MLIPKSQPIRSDKTLAYLETRVMEDARSPQNPCIRCGAIGSTCGRHYNGLRQHQYGKGRGIKCHPFLVADFCSACDAEFQEGAAKKSDLQARIEYSEEFQHWCLMTMLRREERGIVGAIRRG